MREEPIEECVTFDIDKVLEFSNYENKFNISNVIKKLKKSSKKNSDKKFIKKKIKTTTKNFTI